MKIKRFEAPSMSEALRKIKKEFGEEAVILSAKTVKKGSRLLGGRRSTQVVVTAAIDKHPSAPADTAVSNDDIDAAGDGAKTEDREDEGYSRFSILKKFKPITPTGQKKVKPKIVELMNQATDEDTQAGLLRHLVAQGVGASIAADLKGKVSELSPTADAMGKDLPAAMSQVIEALGIVGRRRVSNGPGPRIVAMTGPPGAGKTSAAAKLAARHAMNYGERVGMISLDNHRVAGAAELERYANILDVQLENAGNPKSAADALKSMDGLDLVVVDTPGLCLDDQILREHLRRVLAVFEGAEVHLLLSAVVQEDVNRRTIEFFRPLAPQSIFFTQVDWVTAAGPMINLSVGAALPIALLSDSAKVPEGIHAATADELTALLLPQEARSAPADDAREITVVHNVKRGAAEGFVANRNSDIFHHQSCKSVKRINTQNMIIFTDSAEAMGQQFKPCRMCCSSLLATRTSDRPVHGYAGYRC